MFLNVTPKNTISRPRKGFKIFGGGGLFFLNNMNIFSIYLGPSWTTRKRKLVPPLNFPSTPKLHSSTVQRHNHFGRIKFSHRMCFHFYITVRNSSAIKNCAKKLWLSHIYKRHAQETANCGAKLRRVVKGGIGG